MRRLRKVLRRPAASSKPQFLDRSITFPSIDPSKQIRLLHLSSSREHGIACQLSVASIDEPPPYEALSYVWGDAKDLKVITVDGHAFRVTQNLYAALDHLVPLDDGPRVLWIDAICINQGTRPGDLAERGQQVRLMGTIFSGATSVIAYLGEPHPYLFDAMELLTAAAGGQQSDVDRLVQRADYNATEVWGALISFFNRPWWDRVWTVQEFIVGRQVSFHFGRLGVSSDSVRFGMYNIIKSKIRAPIDTTKMDPTSGELLSTAFTKFVILSLPHNRRSLLDALGAFQNRDSEDPRDKIYSLMGLFPSSDHVDLDYTIPPEQLFEDFTWAWIQKHQDLSVLGYLHDPESRLHKNTPSFAIDWSYRPSIRTIGVLHGRRTLQSQVFNACKGSQALWHRISTGQARANGFVFDSIKSVGAKHVREIGSSWASRFRTLQCIVDMADVIMGGNDSRQKENLITIRHTLCMDSKHEAGVYTRLRVGDDERLLAAWWDTLFNPSPPPLANRPAFEADPIKTTAWLASIKRSFIFTENGSMGLAPEWCKAGDAIAVMAGGAVPVVLRPVGEVSGQEGDRVPVFEVVGEAYVHGFMDGQAFDVSGRAEGEFDDIYIV